MAATLTRMTLAQLLDGKALACMEPETLIREARPLNPTSIALDPVIDELGYIADGAHRIAGMIRCARDRGRDLADVVVDIVICDDGRVGDAANAEDLATQKLALDSIYDEVYQ